MKFTTIASLLIVALLSACAATSGRNEEAKEALSQFSAYTGEPVTQFNMYSKFDSWSAVDDQHLLVHTNVNESYLLTLAPPCMDLPFATRIALTSRFPNTVQAGFDSVRTERESCRILEIRPVNYKQMKADLAEAKKARG